MPTSRKRIGFLPSDEVKKIIDKICLKNKFSQSKVTGILVEEALKARNLYRSKSECLSSEIDLSNDFHKNKITNERDSKINNNNEKSADNEYELIKEYLKYKNFKKILSIIKSEGLSAK